MHFNLKMRSQDQQNQREDPQTPILGISVTFYSYQMKTPERLNMRPWGVMEGWRDAEGGIDSEGLLVWPRPAALSQVMRPSHGKVGGRWSAAITLLSSSISHHGGTRSPHSTPSLHSAFLQCPRDGLPPSPHMVVYVSHMYAAQLRHLDANSHDHTLISDLIRLRAPPRTQCVACVPYEVTAPKRDDSIAHRADWAARFGWTLFPTASDLRFFYIHLSNHLMWPYLFAHAFVFVPEGLFNWKPSRNPYCAATFIRAICRPQRPVENTVGSAATLIF